MFLQSTHKTIKVKVCVRISSVIVWVLFGVIFKFVGKLHKSMNDVGIVGVFCCWNTNQFDDLVIEKSILLSFEAAVTTANVSFWKNKFRCQLHAYLMTLYCPLTQKH